MDAGVEEGDEIGVAYDPMIAKLIAHGPTRDEAFLRMRDALAETDVSGLTTNLPFLRWLVRHPAVRAGRNDDRIPRGVPAALGAACAAEWPLGRRLAAQPPAPSTPLAARRGRSRACRTARSSRRAEHAHCTDARDGDQGARCSRRTASSPARRSSCWRR